MSYCRFSSDDWASDVYVYADVDGGWTTHVAAWRAVLREPLPPAVPFPAVGDDREATAAWVRRRQIVMDMVGNAEMVEITLPHAGESFNDPSAGACADRLERLRELGYHVPQKAVDDLRAEGPGQ